MNEVKGVKRNHLRKIMNCAQKQKAEKIYDEVMLEMGRESKLTEASTKIVKKFKYCECDRNQRLI